MKKDEKSKGKGKIKNATYIFREVDMGLPLRDILRKFLISESNTSIVLQ